MAFDRGSVVFTGSRVRVAEEHGGRVARLVLSNPPENVVDLDLAEQLLQALELLADRPLLSGLIIEGERDFSAGFLPSHQRPPFVDVLHERYHEACRRFASLEAIRIALVRGRCFGAGFGLALLCHELLADATARFAFPEAAHGSFSPVGVALLAGRIGPTKAYDWLLTGRVVQGDEALSAGLVTAFAGGWDTVETLGLRHLDQLVLSRPTGATRTLAQALSRPVLKTLEEELPALDALYRERIADSADHDEGLSALIRGRPPRWREGA